MLPKDKYELDMDDSMAEIDKINYTRGIGAYKPHF